MIRPRVGSVESVPVPQHAFFLFLRGTLFTIGIGTGDKIIDRETDCPHTMGSTTIQKNGNRRDATPHASAAYQEWAALQSRLGSSTDVRVNGRDLTIADVVAVSL